MEDSFEREIDAMKTIASALEALNQSSRERVLRYVMERIGAHANSSYQEKATVSQLVATPQEERSAEIPVSSNIRESRPIDIRSLVGEKKPRSAIEMVTLVAFYLSEVSSEKKKTVTVADMDRYFKQGAYPLPKVVRFALTNAKDAGYLEIVNRGEYRLTPVGHNLVAHEMPTKATSQTSKATRPARRGK